MELEWPLILFTTFIAWCGGLFGTQCLMALRGKGAKTQLAAWITSAVLLVVGGISVFMHLQHWERIFNGFGHITSGITQEFIAIILIAICALVYIYQLMKKGGVQKPVCIVGLVLSIALVAVTGHSYMMAALPTWNTVLQILSLIGAACVLGPATFAVLASFTGDAKEDLAGEALIGSIANAVLTIVYIISIVAAQGSFTNMGYYFDPTRATLGMTNAASFSPFSATAMPCTIAVIVCVVLAVLAALMGKKQGWKVWGIVMVVCGVAAAICLRIVFYLSGGHVFLLF
jgi:DMSO reductase anchor subunit